MVSQERIPGTLLTWSAIQSKYSGSSGAGVSQSKRAVLSAAGLAKAAHSSLTPALPETLLARPY